MNTYFKRTLCSFVFASLISTQLSGMFSIAKDKKPIANIVSKTFGMEETKTLPTKKKITHISFFDPAKTCMKHVKISIFSKKKVFEKGQDSEEESQETKEKKTKKKNRLLAITSTGVVLGFLYKERKRFVPQINAVELPVGWGDLTPVIQIAKEAVKSTKDIMWFKPEIIVPTIAAVATAPGAATYFGAVLGLFTFKYFTGDKNDHYNPSQKDIDDYAQKVYSGEHFKLTSKDKITRNAWLQQLENNKNSSLQQVASQALYTFVQAGVDKVVQDVVKASGSVTSTDTPKFNPETPKPKGPELPKQESLDIARDLSKVAGSATLNEPNKVNTIDSDEIFDTPPKKPLTEEQKEFFTYETASTIAGLVAQQVVKEVAAKIAVNTIWSIWNSSDIYTKNNVTNLLGLKIPTEESDPEEWRITKAFKFTNKMLAAAGSGIAYQTTSLAEEAYSTILKCIMWERKSVEECYGKHSDTIRYKIETVYKKELSKITNIDDKIKYIDQHKGIDEGTKKTSINMLKEAKKFNEARELDRKTLDTVLKSKETTNEQKKRAIEVYNEGSVGPISLEENEKPETAVWPEVFIIKDFFEGIFSSKL